MSNITMSDVAPYFVAYKAKFGEDCTLTVDVIEQIMEGAKDDDALIQGMYEAQHTDDDTSSGKEDDRSDEGEDNLPAVIDTTEGSAYAYAQAMDDTFAEHLEVLADAAMQNKRGGAVIMFDLFRLHTEEVIVNVWPVPGSKADNGRMIGNRLAAKYATTVKKDDGTTGEGTVDWYSEYYRYTKRGKKLYEEKESLRGLGAKETGPHIWDEHKELIGDAVGLKRNKSRVDQAISNGKSAIVRAVQLAQKMAHYNTRTTMGCEISKEADGSPANSNKLVYIYNTEDRTKFDILTIGQFLALKNVEEGAKYSAIVGSTTRKRKQPEQAKVDYTVNTLDAFDTVSAAYATFWDKIEETTAKKDMKAYNALLTRLNAAGSDDLLLSMNKIMNNIEAVLNKPGIADRLAKLLADPKKKAA